MRTLSEPPLILGAGSMAPYSFADIAEAAAGFSGSNMTSRLRHLAATRETLFPADMVGILADHDPRVSEEEGTPDWLRAGAA